MFLPLKVNISDSYCLNSATSITIPIIPQEQKKSRFIFPPRNIHGTWRKWGKKQEKIKASQIYKNFSLYGQLAVESTVHEELGVWASVYFCPDSYCF